MPQSAAERVKRQMEKLKIDGKYEAFKEKRRAIAKKSRDKLKEEMAELSSRMRSKRVDEIRQKNRDRVRKFRETRKNNATITNNSVGNVDAIQNTSVGTVDMINKKSGGTVEIVRKNSVGTVTPRTRKTKLVSNLVEQSANDISDNQQTTLGISEESILVPSNTLNEKTEPVERPKRRSNRIVASNTAASNEQIEPAERPKRRSNRSKGTASTTLTNFSPDDIVVRMECDTTESSASNNESQLQSLSVTVLTENLIEFAQETEPVERLRRSNRITVNQKLRNTNAISTTSGSSPEEGVSRLEYDSIEGSESFTTNNDGSIGISVELSNTAEAESATPKNKLLRRMGKVSKSKALTQNTYRTDCALRKAMSRATQGLPKNPRKRRTIVIKLYHKFVEPPKMKRKIIRRRFDQRVAESVRKFYERDDISRQAPGLKDFMKVKNSDGIKTTVQIKHLMYPIRTVYEKYCTEMKATPLKLSKFFSLRPRHVISVTKIPHTVCLCPYHENFIYAINGLRKIVPELPEYGDSGDTFYKTFFCETMTKNCWTNQCDGCKDIFRDTLSGIGQNCGGSVNVKWNAWKEFDWIKDGKVMGKRWKRITESGTIIDLVEYILKIAPHFILHAFVKREQGKRYQEDINSMDPSVATVQLDFAENPVCVYQKEIQRAHYNQNQLSLFTAATWICRKIQSYSIVSDNLDHTKSAIAPYVDRLLEDLPQGIQTVKIWSDGPSKQFKNKFMAAALTPLEKKHKVKIQWNFFASSHGKGPVDGIGGALKRQVRETVLAGEKEVRNAAEFASAVDKNSKVKVIVMDELEANERVTKLNLQDIWDNAPSIKGISNFHYLCTEDKKVIGKLLSKDM